MKCLRCKRAFTNGQKVIPVETFVVTERRGNFVTNGASSWIHYDCIEKAPKPETSHERRSREGRERKAAELEAEQTAGTEMAKSVVDRQLEKPYPGEVIMVHGRRKPRISDLKAESDRKRANRFPGFDIDDDPPIDGFQMPMGGEGGMFSGGFGDNSS